MTAQRHQSFIHSLFFAISHLFLAPSLPMDTWENTGPERLCVANFSD